MIYIGILFSLIGYLIRLFSMLHLKNNFSWRVICPSKIIKTGIYKYIRHPMYFGGLILFFGLFIIATKQIMFPLLITIYTFNFYVDRIDREEQLMIFTYGNEYLEYMKKTKTIIPFIF